MKQTPVLTFLFVVLITICQPLSAHARPERFGAASSEGVFATRDDQAVYLQIGADVAGPVTIPRLSAPLRSMHWEGSDSAKGFQLKPEQETWIISWTERPQGAERLVLQFDAPPRLPSEAEPITVSADGSFYLPAHLAMTRGEKIRYEPQSFKNTVGYWAGKADEARWTIRLDQPGRFNVAILQGCGKGQGGSKARLAFSRDGEEWSDATLDFDVVETGHFQNFQWVHLGEVELSTAGKIEVRINPQQIKKAALMDVRAIHLIRLPDKS